MSDRKILVPEGMLTAACTANHGGSGPLVNVLEAALLWLSENPIVPTTAEALTLLQDRVGSGHLSREDYNSIPATTIRCVIREWQRRMFLAPEPEVKFYRKVGDEYIEIENPSEELKAMFNIPPGDGKTACVVTDKKSLVSESDICEIGAVLRDRNIRISNFEVGEILNIARQNVHSELPAFVSKKESK